MTHRPVVLIIGLVLLLGITLEKLTAARRTEDALEVQAVASQGSAAPGNNANANLLVLVTDPRTGLAVVFLTQSEFSVINHFGVPGQSCGFSHNITSFNNVGTGAYQITLATSAVSPPPGGCNWVAGDYLGQVMVTSGRLHGQAAFKLSVR